MGTIFLAYPSYTTTKIRGVARISKRGEAKIHGQLLRIIDEQREESDSKSDGMIEEAAVAVTTSL